MTAATLEAEKTDEKFQNFYKNIVKSAKDIGLEEPFLPRQRSIPDRYEGSLTEIPIFEVRLFSKALKNFSMRRMIMFNMLGLLCSRWSNPPHFPPRFENFCIDFEAS